MGRYIIRRIALGVLTLWIVTILVFGGLRVIMPAIVGDVVDVMMSAAPEVANDPELAARLRREMGLDQPVAIQYVLWLRDMATGDLGTSYYTGRTVLSELAYRVPVSLELSIIGLASSVLLAIPMGLLASVKQDRWPDYVMRIWAVGTSATPNFWLAILIITFGSMWFRWAPSVEYAHLWEDPVQHFKVILLPALLIGLTPSGGLMRIMRTQMLEVLRQDYVRTARSKGLSERIVLTRHAMRNALIPVVTVLGLALPGLLSGSALFEVIFVLPGTGLYLVNAVSRLDYPVIQSTNLIFAILIVGANLLVDISYVYIDPRIRYQ